MSTWNDYQQIRQLGSGAFGVVHLAKCTNPNSDFYDELVAIKMVPLQAITESEAKLAMSEVAILRNLSHPCILRFLDCFIDAESQLCCVTEFVDGGDLSVLIRNAKDKGSFIDNFVVVDIGRQMLEGLGYLHANKVLHRDIKPANIYLTSSGGVKIGDFGVSKLLTESIVNTGTFIGTPFYVCPELCMGEKYDFAADIWALGVTLYELYCLRLPFAAQNVLALVGKISEGNYDKDILRNRPMTEAQRQIMENEVGAEFLMKSQGLGSLVSGLVEQMLVLDPKERPTANELLNAFFGVGSAVDPTEEVSPADVNGGGGEFLPPQSLEPDLLDVAGLDNLTDEQFEEGVEKAVNELPWIKNAMTLSTIAIDENDENAVVVKMSHDGKLTAAATPRRSSIVSCGNVTPPPEAAVVPSAMLPAQPQPLLAAPAPAPPPAFNNNFYQSSMNYSMGTIPEDLPPQTSDVFGSRQNTSAIFQDPQSLEQKLRERAMLYHRKRHQANKIRRQLEADRNAKKQQQQQHQVDAIPPSNTSPHRRQATVHHEEQKRQELMLISRGTPSKKTRSSVHNSSSSLTQLSGVEPETTPSPNRYAHDSNNNSSSSPFSNSTATGLGAGGTSSDDGMMSTLRDLINTHPEMLRSIQQTAAAIINQEEMENEAKALAAEESGSAPSPKIVVNLILVQQEQRIISIKVPDGCSFKKLMRRVKKGLTSHHVIAEPGEDDDGVVEDEVHLSYLDSESDSISIESQLEWKHVLAEHCAHHQGQALSLRCEVW